MSTTTRIDQNDSSLRVVFLHLDWGIGGAEQLMLQLAQASTQAGHEVQLVTTRCDPTHCFQQLSPGGSLHSRLHVWGGWIPANIMGKGQALCSTLRLIYLAYAVCRKPPSDSWSEPDLIVTDVLPTSLVFLRSWSKASLLFYCHFPDQLLIRNQESVPSSAFANAYRNALDWIEEHCMCLADTVTVNSKFTKSIVQKTFPWLDSTPLPVLYPALDTTDTESSDSLIKKDPSLIVSLNRFERKKKLDLLLHAASWLQINHPKVKQPTLVIAGGYDTQSVENVEYRGELGALAKKLNVSVDFQHSISDSARQKLLKTAAAVVYTPENEHFGIVPVEAMYARTPVIAVNSGGPTETIVHDKTGFLCDPTPESFGDAILKILTSPEKATKMGLVGHAHALHRFGPHRLLGEWKGLCRECVSHGQSRKRRYRVVSPRVILYLTEFVLVFFVCSAFTVLLRRVALLEENQSILGRVRSAISGDEL